MRHSFRKGKRAKAKVIWREHFSITEGKCWIGEVKGHPEYCVLKNKQDGWTASIGHNGHHYESTCLSEDDAKKTGERIFSNLIIGAPVRSKYNAVKTWYNGVLYDSKIEAERARALDEMQGRGEIRNLKRQQDFPIVINGKKVCTYRADFVYDRADRHVVEDVKGMITPKAALVLKLMRAVLGIEVELWPKRERKKKLGFFLPASSIASKRPQARKRNRKAEAGKNAKEAVNESLFLVRSAI